MADILGLTTTDKVRAAWGVTVSELPDTLLDALDLADMLTLELSAMPMDYTAVKAAGTGETPTTEELTLWLRLKLFSAFFCAVQATPSMRLAVPQKMGDGNNSFSRFQGDVLDKTCAEVASAYHAARDELLAEAGLSVTTSATLAVSTEPSYDPVAGE